MSDRLKRRELLHEIIENTIALIGEPGMKSYLRTKKYGYERINRNFIGANVLEMGSDESPTTSILARWSERLTVVDCEDKFARKILKDELLSAIRFVRSRWEDYVPEEKYSDIVLTDSLEHVQDPVEILALAKSWLSEGGRIHIIVPNALSVHRLLGVEMGLLDSPYAFNRNDEESGHVRVYDMNLLKTQIQGAGLIALALEGVQFKPLTDVQLATFPTEFMDALDNLSPLFNDNCAELYACCTR